MSDFNWTNFINRLAKPQPNNQANDFKSGQPTGSTGSSDVKFQLPKEVVARQAVQKAILQNTPQSGFRKILTYDFKMNNIASADKSLYIKDLMNLPKDLKQMLATLQNNAKTATDMSKLFGTNINLVNLAELMQKNGKEAMSKLIFAMSEASKQGITDTSQLKDAIKYINASVSVAAQENPNQVLKNFMLLYLPWLPLQEGVDFELEIEQSLNEDGAEETSVTILISTINFGNIKVTLILEGLNNISIIVQCPENFPKEELLKRISVESKTHSIQSNVSFSETQAKNSDSTSRQAKVSMSTLTEVNPFLLLMTNAVIRNTIALDNEAG